VATIFENPPVICTSQAEIIHAAELGRAWVIHLVWPQYAKFYELYGKGYGNVLRGAASIGQKASYNEITYYDAVAKLKEKLAKGYSVALSERL
jgi:hypothetical protein